MKNFKNTILLGFISLMCSCSNSSDWDPGTATTPPPTIPPVKVYTDAELMTMVQDDVLKYFWDFAEVNSKLARERYHTDNPSNDANTVAVGASGFGLMTILVGIQNGSISRTESVSKLATSLEFLEKADRFHGAWPHWLEGTSGKVKPFSSDDDGADLVETAFLVQGLLCVREYFKNSTVPTEKALAEKADDLWKGVEWDWFTQSQNVLYWHWSPKVGFAKNHKIQGFDETLITYILAGASPTHPISKEVYQQGYARNGAIKSSGSVYGIPLIAAHNGVSNNVGPMFWSHYSFLALDPRGLSDGFVNYGDVTTNHAKIMYQYAIENPKKWSGYSAKNWGLTASYTRNSDGTTGYASHSPSNDTGVISPTAALSSMPYTATESMNVLRFLYNDQKSKYVGVAGPYDAYSMHYDWVTPRYLGIDQGTISPMIENHKSQFLWKLFMNAPEIKAGLQKLGFTSARYGI